MSAMTLPPVNPAPIPTQLVAPPAPGAPSATGPGSFSQLLEAADARRQPETAAAPPAPENKAQNANNRPQAPTPKAPPRETTKTGSTAPTDADSNTAERTADQPASADGDAQDSSTPADAASLLASLGLIHRAQTPAEALGRAGRGGLGRQALDSAADAALARAAGAGAGTGAAAAGALAADAKPDTAERSSAGKAFAGLLAAAQGQEAHADSTAALAVAAEQRLAPQAEARPADASALGALLGAAAPAAHAPTGPGHSAAHPAEARLSTTPGQAGFAEQLGAQLSTFVREGVQHARLQLHPLELGPVTVQIQLDGGSAHMSFAAEHAQTRQALEQALPTLAGSLREAGLTLSGGGVFEQAQQPPNGGEGGRGDSRGDGRGEGRTAQGASDDGNALQAASHTALRRRGVVDLVA